jgi:hypothetical protein
LFFEAVHPLLQLLDYGSHPIDQPCCDLHQQVGRIPGSLTRVEILSNILNSHESLVAQSDDPAALDPHSYGDHVLRVGAGMLVDPAQNHQYATLHSCRAGTGLFGEKGLAYERLDSRLLPEPVLTGGI